MLSVRSRLLTALLFLSYSVYREMCEDDACEFLRILVREVTNSSRYNARSTFSLPRAGRKSRVPYEHRRSLVLVGIRRRRLPKVVEFVSYFLFGLLFGNTAMMNLVAVSVSLMLEFVCFF